MSGSVVSVSKPHQSLRTRVFNVLLQHEQRQAISQRIDPKIILTNAILQLTTLELVQSIENELLENPALEALDDAGCAGNCIDANACPHCSALVAARRGAELGHNSSDSCDQECDNCDSYVSFPRQHDDDFDPVSNLEAETTLQQHLSAQLRATAAGEDIWIGEYLINCLDDKGWIKDSPENIAEHLLTRASDVRRILGVIQTFDPPGIAAQSLRQCLLLQLRYLREIDLRALPIIDVAARMIANHYEHFCARRYGKLARGLKITPEDARVAVNYVRDRLNPFPANQFRSPWVYCPNNKTAVRPDIIVCRGDYGFDVEVVPDAYMLSVNTQYRDLYLKVKGGGNAPSSDERRHIVEYVERAERFIRSIKQRRITLRQITLCIVEYQAGFMETGSHKFLRPLTRTRIAHQIGIHESTVSRATANKFVQLPNQDVISFEVFFDASLSAKEAIEAIILAEDPAHPLSDHEIVDELKANGFEVARRTIVKYRNDRKILSSNRRRR